VVTILGAARNRSEEDDCDWLAEHPKTPPTTAQEFGDLLPPEEGEHGASPGSWRNAPTARPKSGMPRTTLDTRSTPAEIQTSGTAALLGLEAIAEAIAAFGLWQLVRCSQRLTLWMSTSLTETR